MENTLPVAKSNAVRDWLIAVLLLAIGVYLCHRSALEMFWSYDDGAFLDIATRVSPLQYFLDPTLSQVVSGASISLWNPFTYFISLKLFGLDPYGAHLHHVVVLWLTALATFCLLRLWAETFWAMLGASLFLVGAPVVYISHELMNGHYLYGLLFSIISIYFFVRHLRSKSGLNAALAATFYLLALACKELYVPLPLALIFLPEGRWRDRIRVLVPFFVLLSGYIYWRWLAFGGQFLGPRGATPVSIAAINQLVTTFPSMLFGEGTLTWLTVFAAVALLATAVFRSRSAFFFFLVTAGVIFLPLAPTAASGDFIPSNGRYLYLLWWVLSVALIVSVAGLKRRSLQMLGTAATLGIGLSSVAHAEAVARVIENHTFVSVYRFIAQSSEKDLLLLSTAQSKYLAAITNGYIAAERRLFPDVRRAMVPSISRLMLMGTDLERCGYQVWAEESGQVKPALPGVELNNAMRRASEPRTDIPVKIMRPPYPPIKLRQHGNIDHLVVSAKDVRLQGWSQSKGEFALGTPSAPVSITVMSRKLLGSVQTSCDPEPGDSSFDLVIHYSNDLQAREAADLLCLAIGDSEFTILHNRFNPACDQLADATLIPIDKVLSK